MSTASKPPGKAMYVAPRPDWDWLRIAQRTLYARREKDTAYVFRKLWGLVTDPRNLRMALARVASNRGRRTAGVDGITFDNIDHHGLMNRVRRRVSDPKVNRLIVAFLKAGILAEGNFVRSDAGTPQGGILSPLLANIALSIIEERYELPFGPAALLPRGATRPSHNTERRTLGRPTGVADERSSFPFGMRMIFSSSLAFLLVPTKTKGPRKKPKRRRLQSVHS